MSKALLDIIQDMLTHDRVSDPNRLNWVIPIATLEDLPKNPSVGDATIVVAEVTIMVFNGAEWIEVDPDFEF